LKKVISEAIPARKTRRPIPGTPEVRSAQENIESLAKKVFVDGDRKSETDLVKQLKKQFGDDGYTWEQTLLDIVGIEYEDSVDGFVYDSIDDF
jgi:hypothetical protein